MIRSNEDKWTEICFGNNSKVIFKDQTSENVLEVRRDAPSTRKYDTLCYAEFPLSLSKLRL